MKKILVLTAAFGEGHNTAAKNIREALEKQGNGQIDAEVYDLYEACYPRISSGLQRGYKFTINKAPQVWQKIYDVLDHTRIVERNLFTIRNVRKALEVMIAELQPAAIVSTYPVYNYLLDRMYKQSQKPFKQFTMVTDAITINSVWFRCKSHPYMVTDPITADVLKDASVPSDLIRITGFPVSDRFDQPDATSLRPPLVDGTIPKILYLIHTESAEALVAARWLLSRDDLEVTIWVGRNAHLRRRIAQLIAESGRPASILGWTTKMPEMLLKHHLVIGKAGGATVQEAIAARCPMIVSQLVPGQEEGNLRLILENEIGQLAITAKSIAHTVRHTFDNQAQVWHQWSKNFDKVRHPEAAKKIARYILDSIEAV